VNKTCRAELSWEITHSWQRKLYWQAEWTWLEFRKRIVKCMVWSRNVRNGFLNFGSVSVLKKTAISVWFCENGGSVLKQMSYNLSTYLLSTSYTVWQCMLYASLFVICYVIRTLTLSLCFSCCSGWVLHIAVQLKEIMPHHVECAPHALFFTLKTSQFQNCIGVTRIWKYCWYFEFYYEWNS